MPSKVNLNAEMMGLEDAPGPGAPLYVIRRFSIEKHRNGERPPVGISPKETQVRMLGTPP